jgi:argininosuccinate synthase
VDAFAHGCTGKGNDQFRIEFMLRTLMPSVPIIAPMRERNMTRSEEIEYARARGVPIHQSSEKIWEHRREPVGTLHRRRTARRPQLRAPRGNFPLDAQPARGAPRTAGHRNRLRERRAVAVDGQRMEPLALIQYLNELAGEHGVGASI